MELYNTLILIFCIVIIALYTLIPLKGEETQNFILTFDSDGGSAIAAIEVTGCGVVEQPVNPTKEGYVFVGWELDGNPFNFTEEVCGDVELKAVWEEKDPESEYITYFIQRNPDEEPSQQEIKKGEIPTQPEDPYREGYEFVEWRLNGYPYSFDTPLNEGDMIAAVWIEETSDEDDTEYIVSFNLNGGAVGGNCDDQTVMSGNTVSTNCSPTRDEYSFLGWNTNKNAKSALNLKNVKITKNTTLYAIWKANSSSSGSSSGGNSSGGSSSGGSSSGGSSSGGGTTPSTPTTYNISCNVNGSNTYTGTSTNSATSAAASTCNGHKGSNYNLNLYTVNFTASSCSLSSTNLTCSTNAVEKSFTVTCKEQYNGNNAKTSRCKATSDAGSGSSITLNGQSYNGNEIPDSLANSATWGICFDSACANSSKVSYKYSE